MAPQRYQAVNTNDDHDVDSPISPSSGHPVPDSPPPSFRSRASSPTSRRLLSQDPLDNDVDQNLADAFDDGEDSDAENDGDSRQRLMRADTSQTLTTDSLIPGRSTNGSTLDSRIERRVTDLPAFRPSRSVNAPANDGVFANLSAKPERGEQIDEKPPTYEQAAADATPPYWETTVLAPGMSTDEVYVDGLPVGSLFSFIWNGMISAAFQLPGFLLTYLLHTTHAAKNGSLAGLGLMLVQFGFLHGGRSSSSDSTDKGNSGQYAGSPPDPNSHNFDPNHVDSGSGAGGAGDGATRDGLSNSDWIYYLLMIIGWFILIRAIVNFLRVKRHEKMVLGSPSRGLPVPIIAEGESPERTA